MNLFLFGLAATVATILGGTLALTFRDKLHLVLGFSAGAVAGVALFDLLPEAIELTLPYHDAQMIALFVALGFFGYLVLDRLILLHTHEEDDEANAPRGILGALTLSAHSFLDGVAIGIGFQAGSAVGFVVTAAVLTHDFSDGINTVNLIFRNGGDWVKARRWLIADALAPLVGVISTLFYQVSSAWIGPTLALFTGTFLYLSASDLIPESHHRHPRLLTTCMTLLGALVLFLVTRFAS